MDKVVCITGGTSGIGLKTAELFLRKGYQVVICGRNQEKGLAVEADLKEQYGKNINYVPGDVSKVSDCEAIIENTLKLYGRLDVLVNSAGIYLEKPLDGMTETDFYNIMDINVKGVYFMCQKALMALKKTGGNIINVSSDAGVHGNYGCSAYCASKGAVTMFTKALALDMAGYGVRVNCVAPGDIMTPLTENQLTGDREAALREMAAVYPLGRIGTADEVASVIVFLASEAAGFVTGAVWSVDGGITA